MTALSPEANVDLKMLRRGLGRDKPVSEHLRLRTKICPPAWVSHDGEGGEVQNGRDDTRNPEVVVERGA